MTSDDVICVAQALKDNLKSAIRRQKKQYAPLSLIIDDLQDRHKAFSPRYAAYGRTLRPYAASLDIKLPANDTDLHQWISKNLENLRKGAAPALAKLIVSHLADTRHEFLFDHLAKIEDTARLAGLSDKAKAELSLRRIQGVPAIFPLPGFAKRSPENVFYRALREDFNLRDWEIGAHRILQERKSRTGMLDLSKLRIDSLPDTVGDLTWLRDFSCSVTSITKLDGLDRFEKLEILHCSYGKLRELPDLDGCKMLSKITCGVTAIDSLVPIENCPSMKQLFCGSTYVSDLSPLGGCSELTVLHCEDTLVSKLEGLETCSRLRLLDCADTAVSSLQPIEGLSNLETLILNGCHIREYNRDFWQSPSLKEVIFCRGKLEGVPSHVLSRSFDENCLSRIRNFLERNT